jgi:hypothetical protein
MIYNLVLNSATNQYASAILPSDMGQRVYGIDWSFLPENKNFKVTFSFLCKRHTTAYSYQDIYMLAANFGPMALVWEGSNKIQSKNSMILGALRTTMGNAMVATDTVLCANYSDNPPFMLLGRPTNNLLEIWVWKNTAGTGSSLPTDYILTLSFEAVDQ